jgi:hypothetical protein
LTNGLEKTFSCRRCRGSNSTSRQNNLYEFYHFRFPVPLQADYCYQGAAERPFDQSHFL